jgi:diacylglycerol kinase (ATP)
MKRALLLVNGGARRASAEADRLVPLLEAKGMDVIGASERDPAHFPELIHRFRDRVDRVVVAGGDGTCLCAAEPVRDAGLPLGILPLGTANNLARNLELPLDLDAAVEVAAGERVRRIDLGFVNDRPFFNVSGLGLSTLVNRQLPRELKRRWGILAYVLYAARVLRRTSPFSVEIRCDGRLLKTRSLQITVCNGRHYGPGLTIRRDAAIDDGWLDLLTLEPSHWWQGLRLLPALLSGRYRRDSGVRLMGGRTIEIRTRRPLPVDTDGEITTRTPAKYRLVAGALEVFAPRGEERRLQNRAPVVKGVSP